MLSLGGNVVLSRRIAFHFYSLAQGGVERMRITLARELLSRGFDVDFVLVRAEGELSGLVPEGVRIFDLKARRTLSSIKPLTDYMRHHAPDAMFASMGPQNIAAIAARRFAGAKTWLGVMQHNALSDESKAGISLQQALVPLAYRCFLSGADGIYAVSGGVADDMAKMIGYDRGKVGVLYNPACPTALALNELEEVSHPFFDSGEPVVIGCGRLVAQKGWSTLLNAFAKVVAKRPARLLLLGVGPEEAELKALSASLGLDSHVAFLGFQSAPLAWMKRSDLFVMSSRYEGFGNVIVEALSVDTAVVSTDCNYGPAEILDNGKYGALVPVDDAAAMASAIIEALNAPKKADLVARAQEFSVAYVVDNYLRAAFGEVVTP